MKNIILLITDTYRWDNLRDRAERPVRTPELDAFADQRATEVTRFYTGSFPTIPHRTDVAQGVLGWPHYGWQPIDTSGPNHVSKILRKHGYTSQLICDCPHLFNTRFQHGFDAAFQNRGQEGDKHLLHLNDPIRPIMPVDKTRTSPSFRGAPLASLHRWMNRYYKVEEETFAYRTASVATRWLEENNHGGLFFLWVDFFDPHEPWDPPEYMVRRYDPSQMDPPMIHPNYGRSDAYTDAELKNLWAHYAAEAEIVDRAIGRVLQKIDDLQLWDETIVLVTSDHGMSIGEHGRTGKSNINENDGRNWPIYPEISHVPFLIAGGGVPRAKAVDCIGQPIDILPTLCELAGVSAAPPTPFEGKSLAQVIQSGEGTHRDFAVSGSFGKYDYETVPERVVTPFAVEDKWGYAPLGAAGAPELYDLGADPLAQKDVAGEHPDVVKSMHERFVAHLKEHNAPEATVGFWEAKK